MALSDAQWAAIRQVWEYDPDEPTLDESGRRAGEKHDFKAPTRQAIYKHQVAEGWQRRGSMAGIVQAAQRKADQKVTSIGTPEPPPEENAKRLPTADQAYQAREEAEDKRAELLVRHRMEWHKIILLRDEAIEFRNEDPGEADRRAKLAKTLADVTKLQQEGERKAWGLDDVMPLPDFARLSDEQLRALSSGKTMH